jgi:hypothetical protein
MNFPQIKLPELVRQACELKGVAVCAPEELLFASMFGASSGMIAYKEVCNQVDKELLAAGYTHLEWEDGSLTEI